MRLYFDEIRVGERKLVSAGEFLLPRQGLTWLRGENGSGKTMLIQHIFFNPQNAPVPIVLVDQKNEMLSESLSVLDNIRMSFNSERKNQIAEQVKGWGFETLLSKKVRGLSGGEKRLVNLFRGIFSGADLIIMDEPTNDLDFVSVEKILKILQKEAAKKSILLVSHDDRINQAADIIYCLRDQELLCTKGRPVEPADQEEPRIPVERDRRVLKKMIPRPLLSLILCLVLSLFSFWSLWNIQKDTTEVEVRTHERQVNLYLPYSMKYTLGSSGPLHISVLLYGQVDSMMAQLSMAKELYQSRNDEKAPIIPLNSLDSFKSTETYTVFPIEYYHPIRKQYTNTLDYYAEKFFGLPAWQVKLNTSAYFQMEELLHNQGEELIFNPEDFFSIFEDPVFQEDYLDGAYPTMVVVVMHEGYTNEDFYEDSQFQSLLSTQVLVHSREAAEAMQSIEVLWGSISASGRILLMGAGFFIVLWLGTRLFWKAHVREIDISRNYGFDEEAVTEAFAEKTGNRMILLLLYALLVLATVAFSRLETAWLILLLTAMFYSLYYSLSERLLTREIRRRFNGEAR